MLTNVAFKMIRRGFRDVSKPVAWFAKTPAERMGIQFDSGGAGLRPVRADQLHQTDFFFFFLKRQALKRREGE